jgi:hypothetical protein
MIADRGLGQGPNVVLDLATKAKLPEGSEIFMDNLFTSFPLLEKLSEMGIAGKNMNRKLKFIYKKRFKNAIFL